MTQTAPAADPKPADTTADPKPADTASGAAPTETTPETSKADDEAAKQKAEAEAKALAAAEAKATREAAERTALEDIGSVRAGLYKTKDGWSATYGPPFHADATIQALVKKGLAEIEPTGGRVGSVKITDKGRAALQAAA